jgi:signal transduction histidine kinase
MLCLQPRLCGRGIARSSGGTANGTRGAGRGLSTVRAVVLAHDGEISSTAWPTGGMDIAVHLPQAPMSG